MRLAPLDLGGVGAGWAHVSRAEPLVHRGYLTEARTELEAARALRVDVNEQGWAAFLRVQAASPPRRVTAWRSGPRWRPAGRDRPRHGRPWSWTWRCCALGEDPHPDPDLVAAVHADAHRLGARLGEDLPHVAAWIAIADAEAADATSRSRGSAALWRAALERCEADGLVPQTATAQLRLAEASTAEGRPTESPSSSRLRTPRRRPSVTSCCASGASPSVAGSGSDSTTRTSRSPPREVAAARWAREGEI